MSVFKGAMRASWPRTDERSKSRDKARFGYALQGGGRRSQNWQYAPERNGKMTKRTEWAARAEAKLAWIMPSRKWGRWNQTNKFKIFFRWELIEPTCSILWCKYSRNNWNRFLLRKILIFSEWFFCKWQGKYKFEALFCHIMTTPEKTLSHLRAINYICLHSEGRRTGPWFVSVLELPQVCDQRLPMCPPWSACKGQPKRRGNTLLPLQGAKFPRYTRLPRVPLRLP